LKTSTSKGGVNRSRVFPSRISKLAHHLAKISWVDRWRALHGRECARLIRARGRFATVAFRQHRRDARPAPLSQRCSGVIVLSKTPKPAPALTRKRVRELEKTFAHFGLNAGSPEDWPRLKEQVAPHLGQHSKSGRPKGSLKWTEYRLLTLALDLCEVSKHGATAQEAAAMLKKDPGYAFDYADCGGCESLRKRIPQAKRPWQRVLDGEPTLVDELMPSVDRRVRAQ
jgi:hypothetical protein